MEANVEGRVSGHATNYSPATQLSGFDYVFRGTAFGLALPGEVSRRRGEGLIDIALDEDGNPESQRL